MFLPTSWKHWDDVDYVVDDEVDGVHGVDSADIEDIIFVITENKVAKAQISENHW